MRLTNAAASLVSSLRFEFTFHLSCGTEDPQPQGDTYASTELASSYPVGFRIEPVE